MKPRILLLLLFPLFSFAQQDSLLNYTEVVPVGQVSKDQLYARARAWLVDAFKSSKEVLQVQDKEAGELIGKGTVISNIPFKNLLASTTLAATTSFKISIWVKDERYKYEITDLTNYGVQKRSSTIWLDLQRFHHKDQVAVNG